MATALPDSNVRSHDRFFFSDGSFYLLVENSLYRVHKYLFEIHATMFPVRELETSVTKPYVLEDVKKIDFDRLLANLYPRTLGVEEIETTQDWISVLGLASRWGFNSLRSKAISKIEQTLDSPVDMVTLGHQYGIPDLLLPGYAVLCQSIVPLSYEEGLRLGMEDVVNIYCIRHELYGSGITPVPLEVAFARVKEAGLGDERPRQELEGEQASTWTDVGSVATSQTSAENEEERGSVTLTPNVDFLPLEVASTDAAILASERPEQCHVDAHSPSDEPTSVALGKGGSDVPSSVLPGNVSDLNSGSSASGREGLYLIEEITDKNFDLFFVEIMQWVNTKDIQTLHQITRLIVEKAIEVSNGLFYKYNPYPRLCKAMMKYTQTLHQITRLIAEQAMEEPHQLDACVSLCNMMIKDPNDPHGYSTVTAGGLSFGKYIGEICQENLEAIATSVAGAGEHTARIRSLRLIELIGALTCNVKNIDLFSSEIMQWVNMKDTGTLHQIMHLIVEKAINVPENPNPPSRYPPAHDSFTTLCKEMMKYTQTSQPMTRLIVEKAMEEPGRISACVKLCKMLKSGRTADPFNTYLCDICWENLEAITASVAAGELTARGRRLRLIELIGALTYNIFGIAQWVDMKDFKTLHQITRLIVEMAIKTFENPNLSSCEPVAHDPFASLCKEMVRYPETLYSMTESIVEKAMEEPGRISACVKLCNMMKGKSTAIGSGFDEHLGEICQQNLEVIAASVAAGELMARVRRLRLIEFIGALVDLGMWAINRGEASVIDKWVTALLDANDEEKVVTLCMAMTRASGWLWTSPYIISEKVGYVAQKTTKHRVRKLLEDVTKGGRVKWVVPEPSEDCTVQ